MRSSIFSFETLRLETFDRRAVLRAVLGALVVLLACEGALRLCEGKIRHFDIAAYPFEHGERMFYLRDLANRVQAQPDILVIGDSTIETGFSPDAFAKSGGGSAVNAGTGVNNTERLSGALHEITGPIGIHPKRIVVGWSYIVFHGKDPATPAASARMNEYSGVRKISGHPSLLDHLAVWRYRDFGRAMFERGGNLTLPPVELQNNKGWTIFPLPFNSHPQKDRDAFVELVKGAIDVYELTPEIRDNVEATFADLEATGLPVTFILMPINPELRTYDPRIEGILEQLRREILPMAARHNLAVIDATNLGFLKPEHFMDLMHLNQEGAVIFSRWLASQPAMIQPPPSTHSSSP
jgi:hypothetical protein